jgi:ATP-dependent protease ClpP protease subunit
VSQRERRIARVAGEGAAARRALRSPRRKAERDFIMNAQQAKEYGIVDDIIFKHK